MSEVKFRGAFEKLNKDREGEVKVTFTVPLSDEQKVREIPVLEELEITIKSI